MATVAQTIDLSGKWLFAIGDNPKYDDTITLPGSMLTNNKGDDVSVDTRWVCSIYDSSYYFNPYMAKYRLKGKIKLPFFLTPKKHYVGTAWYKHSFNVPKNWKKKRIILFLERPHIETTIFVNGHEAGRDSSLSAPHEFDVTPYIKAGTSNDIELRIYNGIENVCVGQDSHSVTDQTQGDWNGIIGRIELQARPTSYIRDVQVYPDVKNKSIRVVAHVCGKKGTHELTLLPDTSDCTAATKIKFTGDSLSTVIYLGDSIKLWDEFAPNLYTLSATLDGIDKVTTTYGMRDFYIKGKQFYINGRPIWLRGTVENCCFPLTGYPPTDEETWLKIFHKCKEYGLNAMRFHSYCPPEAAFTAADKTGFYLQPEGPSWPNHGVRLGKGMSIDRYLLEETKRMVKAYGNHPSFCMLAAGNEPAGNWVEWAGNFVDYWRQTGDNRRVYCGASVGGGWAFDPKSQYHVKGGARGLNWNDNEPQSTDDFQRQITTVTQGKKQKVTFNVNEPYVSHEQGQWCAFPDFKESKLYTGAYKAYNFEIFKDLLCDNGMEAQADKFLMASGKLQTLAYKYEIERNLRTPDHAGFHLLSLNDYSGQGTALVGVLNVFWKEKGYCSAKDWRQFCSPVVPLAKFPKFIYANSDTLDIDVEMYNAYKETLKDTRTMFYIHDTEKNEYAHGPLSQKDIAVGKNIQAGKIKFPLSSFHKPIKLTLTIVTNPKNHIKHTICNTWNFWVYPNKEEMPVAKDILITDTLDEKAQGVLRSGGKVLITAAGKVRFGNVVKQTFLPVFWNTSWFKMRPPHTTGAYIDTKHPLFKHFLTDSWTDLNWWQLINKAQVMNLSGFPKDYQPAIQPIDTWHISRKLGMMIEANILGGKLLMTTMDIDSDLSNRIVAQDMRRAILEYMDSNDFNPKIALDKEAITNLFEKESPKVSMYTNSSPDELKPKLK